MLEWTKDINPHNGHCYGYIGLEDGTALYRVYVDENGWYYEYLPDADGMDGYDTAQEAMEAAEADFQHWNRTPDDSALENDFDLLEELTAETELQDEGLENWMNSNIFATYRSNWD